MGLPTTLVSRGCVTKKQNRWKIKWGGMIYADNGGKEEAEEWHQGQIRTGQEAAEETMRTQAKDIWENGESSVSAEQEKEGRHGPFDSVAKGQS